MRLTLEVQTGPAAGRTVEVSTDQPFYVGRTETAYLAISDRKMAPSHFVIECTKDACYVRDLSGRFGTFVNGDKTSRTALRDGDVITAGESKFLVHLGQAQAAPAAPSKPAEAPAAAVAAAPAAAAATPAAAAAVAP